VYPKLDLGEGVASGVWVGVHGPVPSLLLPALETLGLATRVLRVDHPFPCSSPENTTPPLTDDFERRILVLWWWLWYCTLDDPDLDYVLYCT
jgi:hypothetical protein